MTSNSSEFLGVIAPTGLIIPNRINNSISGSTGELCISGSTLAFWSGTNWILLSGSKVMPLV